MKPNPIPLLLSALLCVAPGLGFSQEEAESEEPLFPTEIDLSAAYQDIGLYGNTSKYEQYVTPPEHWFFNNLTIRGQQRKEDDPFFLLDVNRLGEEAYWLDGSIHFVDPAVSIRAAGSHYKFFPEPAPVATQPGQGERTTQDFSLQWLPLNGVQNVRVYRQIQDVNKATFDDDNPGDGLPDRIDYDSDRIGVDLAWTVSSPTAKWKIPLTASIWQEDYAPAGSALVARSNSEETRYEVGLTALDTEQLSVGLSYSHDKVDQEFVASDASSSNTIQLSALAYPIPGLVGRLMVNRTDVDQALTTNGYAESYDTTGLDLSYRYGELALKGGLDYRKIDHVSSTGSFSTDSTRKKYYLQGRRKFSDWLTATIRYEQDDISDPPNADSLVSNLPLYYDDVQKVVYKVDATPLDNLFFYGSFEDGRSENDARGSRTDLDSWVLGGYWQINPRLSASVDHTRQRFDGYATAPVVAPGNTLAAWMPDSRVTTMSGSYMYDPKTFFRATMASTRSIGASDSSLDALGLMKDHFWELAVDRTIDKDLSFSVAYRYDSYRDETQPGMSYRENQIMVILKSRN